MTKEIKGVGTVKYWEEATQNITMAFINRYWKEYPSEVFWVGEEIGGVLFVNDYWFSLANIVDFLRYDYNAKTIFSYMDYALERYGVGENPICIRDYKKLRKSKPKKNDTRKISNRKTKRA